MLDPYATHLEALVNAALESKGNILELGCGNYSTPILSAVARYRGDNLFIKSSSPEWALQFTDFAEVELVDWGSWVPSGRYGMIFLDNEQLTFHRTQWLPELAKHCDTIVMHDSDAAMQHAHYPEMISGFKKIVTYNKHRPWTVVMTC